ncbi:aspartate aminotransferase family protein [Sulfobacillus harzensis]|uniref:Aspartate aminotransferase family protein n=1 Tax=Sulfobacillus harzensis TaxID=2729629 RepID=A0A7Y0L2W1_9FIRM|nr:aspartate aminotransferase family protein [Sulfobacillus harzensis]NMP22289.1 aspartate aminotransferase family protein [Sulfobacillus harzensis]
MDDILDGYGAYMNPSLARTYRFMGLNHAEYTGQGAVVTDADGVDYLDCAGGYGVFVQGYRHPRIVAAAHEQLDLMPLSSRVLVSPRQVELAQRLQELTPGDLSYSFFCNSGAEAVEAALKFARASTGRSLIISTEGAFHGKSYGALSVSGRDLYQTPFKPLLPDVVRIPYGDLEALQAVMSDAVAGVIVEPIQGEGGVIVPPDNYLPGIRDLCDKYGASMIVDEVQTGIGHTGKLFAIEHSGVVPDLLCLAKALGGGVMPIGAVVGRPWVWRLFDSSPLIHTSTFGGNPLACRVGRVALDVTVEEKLPERAAELGAWFIPELKQLMTRHPRLIRDVRGRGLMIGIEFTAPGVGGMVMSELFQRHVLAVYTLNNERVLRLLPPLVIEKAQLETVLSHLGAALDQVELVADDLWESTAD